MHYDLLIILNPPIPNLRDKVAEQMRPFKVDWDIEPLAGPFRWDWYIFGQDGPFSDPGVSELVTGLDTLSSVCRISHLPAGYGVSAAITPDGTWHDLQDFGWHLIDEDSAQNQEALANWRSHFRDIIANHQDAVGVEVHCHG